MPLNQAYLFQVPGVGVASVDALKKADITTTHQLLGNIFLVTFTSIPHQQIQVSFFSSVDV